MAQDLANDAIDMMTNVDLLATQYDSSAMMVEAEKLGLNFQDLYELGFDVTQRCAQNKCEDISKYTYEQFKMRSTNINNKIEKLSMVP